MQSKKYIKKQYQHYWCDSVSASSRYFFWRHEIPFEYQIPVKTCNITSVWCFHTMVAWNLWCTIWILI